MKSWYTLAQLPLIPLLFLDPHLRVQHNTSAYVSKRQLFLDAHLREQDNMIRFAPTHHTLKRTDTLNSQPQPQP